MNEDFFSIVGHLAQRRHKENQLSNAFRACFTHSKSFRTTVLQHLLRICGLPIKTAVEDWTCKTQLTEVLGRKNPDICRYDIELLNSSNGHPNVPVRFRLESKIDTPLTQSQLQRYRRRADVQLVAITKKYPEGTIKWMRRNRIASLRWQDIHRALSAAACDTAIDRFLTGQFLTYLEVSNMAFREIRLNELEQFADLLVAIRTQKRDGIVRETRRFTTGDDCLLMLQDLEREVRDYLPQSGGWKPWGPGYSQGNYDGVWHSLGFERYKGSYNKVRIGCSIDFPENKKEDVYWTVYNIRKGEIEKERSLPVRNYCRNGVVEREKLLKELVSLLKHQKIAK